MRGFTDIDAGIVDENVDAAQFAPNALGHGGDGRLVGDVGTDGYRLRTGLSEFGGCRIRFGLVAPDNCDAGAGARKPAGHAEADAAVAAGDDCDLA